MKRLFALLAWLFATQGLAADWEDSPEIAELFENAGVHGTFVVYDVQAQRDVGHNRARAATCFVPASTFKIPHSLIGLAVGAVKSVDTVLPYRGPANPFSEAWKRDMGLRDAIVLSNVPIYQALARRIGLERMREHLARMDYGNRDVGRAVDTFWLGGPLAISAIEQTRFLARLAQATLPYPEALQKQVQEIVLLEQGDDWQLYGKTGWQNAPAAGVGWWVGWVRNEDRLYAFALNMAIRDPDDAKKRVELGKASLRVLGLL